MIGRSHLTKPFFAAEILEDFSLILTKETHLFLCDTVVKQARGKQMRELSAGRIVAG